ncbi:outer membrane beta-barrel family protein [Flavobacterium branchiicola]|uniref:Outer membrane beta-barrel family protein n=1 Tax=Flavobacterium branchiicola TaxID=1114875 RepID=A0ABV9PKD3_9FLAO|nr:outer membrane beta-barrel family protein [Flavobacterium branchiicola]MBS7256347.1 TonB-dependent receptor [Flavobacterium branchiicola]
MKRIIITLILIISPFFCIGQIKISGKIKDEKAMLAFVDIVLTNGKNQTIKQTLTNSNGDFEIEAKAESYTLTVSHSNYLSFVKKIDLTEPMVLEPIVLVEKSTSLDEVVINSSPTKIRREADKTVVNIDRSPITSTGNIFEALGKTPGLVVRNDQISMLGKSGVMISIDGRMVQLSGEDLSNFLKSLPASDIKEVEVITNPSAKYEAQGNSGVINIIYKKIKKDTWSDSMSLVENQAKYGWRTFRNNFSYQKDKLSFLISGVYNSGSFYREERTTIDFVDSPLKLISKSKEKKNDFSTRLLLDYDFTKNTRVGVQYLRMVVIPTTTDDVKTTFFDKNQQITNYLIGNVDTKDDKNNSIFNFYVDQKLDTLGKKIVFNFDILDYNTKRENSILSNNYSPDGEFLNIDFSNTGNSFQDVSNYSGKIDVEFPIEWVKLSYGGKASFSKTNYQLYNYNTISGTPVLNPLQSNQFDFDENIQSVYVNGSKKFNERWEAQLGLRSEFTQTKGVSLDAFPPEYENKYAKLFPTLYLLFAQNENNTYIVNYGKRINRPGYRQLNPARYFINSQVSAIGNPYLLPSYSNNIELSHTYKSNLSTKISFSATTNSYSVIPEVNKVTNEQTIIFKNFFNEYNYSLTESYQWDITNWLKTDSNIFINYSTAKKTDPAVDVELLNGFEFRAQINNVINFNKSKSIVGEVNFWYDSAYNNVLFHYSASSSLDMAVAFKSLVKNMNLTVGVNDLFNSSPSYAYSTVNGINQSFISYPSNRYFKVSLSYNFGNDKVSKKDRNFGNEEIRRRSN